MASMIAESDCGSLLAELEMSIVPVPGESEGTAQPSASLPIVTCAGIAGAYIGIGSGAETIAHCWFQCGYSASTGVTINVAKQAITKVGAPPMQLCACVNRTSNAQTAGP